MLFGVHDKKVITVECSQINLGICKHVQCADISTQSNEGLVQHENTQTWVMKNRSQDVSKYKHTCILLLKANVTGIFCLPHVGEIL